MNFKKLLLTVVIGVFTVILVACGNDDFPLHDMGYYPIDGEHSFYYVTMEDALELIEDEDFNGVLYFGFPGCPWCQAAVPVLHEASLATEVPVFYVSRRSDLREGDWLDWDLTMARWIDAQFPLQWLLYPGEYEYDEEYGDYVYIPGEPRVPNIFVPFVMHVRNGVVVDAHRGTFEGHARMQNADGTLGPTYPFTDEQRATLLATYKRILNGTYSAGDGCTITLTETDCS